MNCSTPGFPVHHQLPELAQTHVHQVGDAIQPSYPLTSPSPPTFNLSQQQVFSKESVLHIRWPKYSSFSFNISPSNEYSGLISFRIDWFDLLAVQGALKTLLQHRSSKASILQHSAFFIVQISHPYMTTGKAIVLTIQTFASAVHTDSEVKAEPGPCPKAALFLTAPPLLLLWLHSLSRNCLNLPFGNQRKSKRLSEACFLGTEDAERLLCPGGVSCCWKIHSYNFCFTYINLIHWFLTVLLGLFMKLP